MSSDPIAGFFIDTEIPAFSDEAVSLRIKDFAGSLMQTPPPAGSARNRGFCGPIHYAWPPIRDKNASTIRNKLWRITGFEI